MIANPPVNTIRPRISVFAVPPTVGEALTVDPGSWPGVSPFTYTYEWRRCDPPGTLPSCWPIPGAVGDSYTTTEADLGLTLRVWVTARQRGRLRDRDHGSHLPDDPDAAPRAVADGRRPRSAASRSSARCSPRPAARGRGFAPIRYVSVWQRCDATVTVCKAVTRVKTLRYRITRADLGYRIRLSVVATNPIGTIRARSEATEPIILTPPKPKGRRIVGTNRPDYIPGGGGDDQLFGRGGSDTIVAGAGDDRLDGGLGNDYLDAGKGVDRIAAGAGSDTVLAADGDADRISCGAGNDRVIADPVDVVDADCEAVTRSGPATTPTDPATTRTIGPSTGRSGSRGGRPAGCPRASGGTAAGPSAARARPRLRPPRGRPRRDPPVGARRRALPAPAVGLSRKNGCSAGALVARPEERDRAERIGADEDAALRPPERDLLPPAAAQHGQEPERRARERLRDDVHRNAEPLGESGAVAVVPVDQLDHAGRLAERADALLDALAVDRIDQPDAAVDGERVRRALHRRALHPAEAVLELVDEADAHALSSSCAKACSNSSFGCAPSTSSLRSSRKAGTAFAPIDAAWRVESTIRSR